MLDAQLLFSSAQAITATAPSTNVVDELVARDIGAGNALQVNVNVLQAFATLTSLQISFQGSADNSTWNDMLLSPVIAVANLTANQQLYRFVVPPRTWNLPGKNPVEFYRLNYIVGGSNATTGTITAWMTAEPDQDQYFTYPRNYTI